MADKKNDNKKNLIIRLDENFHKDIKVYVASQKTTMQDYVVNLIKNDMEKAKNNN